MAVGNQQRLLYYFTPLASVPGLIEKAQLPVDASVRLVSFTQHHPHPLVWLSDHDRLTPEQMCGDAEVRPGLASDGLTLARVTVFVDDAQYWPRWAGHHHISHRTQRRLDRASGWSSARWWVAPRPIMAANWAAIDALTGRRIWPTKTASPGRRQYTMA